MTDRHREHPDDRHPDERHLGDDVLAALALGELSGRERADALGHLLGCGACREQVDAMVAVSEQLLLAAPEAEPPVGFESAVVDRLVPDGTVGRRRHRFALAAVAVAAALALVVAGVVGARLRPTSDDLDRAAMITPEGREVGTAWTHAGDPSWVLVSVPGWEVWEDPDAPPIEYELLAALDDGTEMSLGTVSFAGDDGSWATTTAVDTGRISTVAIVDTTGRIWCRAQF